ncbi:MAG: hypothetical protein IT258_15355 [Saprospiraceae bacterium]|nr:hypothetical protein [Saprospiraceae bacterium]
MLTNLLILVFSYLGLFQQSNTDAKPAPNPKPGSEIPKPTHYDNEKGGKEPGGGWDLN